MSLIRVVVYHGSYGCETGCCGHYVETEAGERIGDFTFSHPWREDHEQFARELAQSAIEERFGKDHTADLDWANTLILED